MGVWSHPLRDGLHDPSLDFIRLTKPLGALSQKPRVEVCVTTTLKNDQQPESSHLLPHCHHNVTRWTGGGDEGHSKTMLCRTVGEPSTCQQCYHDRHHSTTPHHVTAWGARPWWLRRWPCLDLRWCHDKTGWIDGQVYSLLPPSGSRTLGLGSKNPSLHM